MGLGAVAGTMGRFGMQSLTLKKQPTPAKGHMTSASGTSG